MPAPRLAASTVEITSGSEPPETPCAAIERPPDGVWRSPTGCAGVPLAWKRSAAVEIEPSASAATRTTAPIEAGQSSALSGRERMCRMGFSKKR